MLCDVTKMAATSSRELEKNRAEKDVNISDKRVFPGFLGPYCMRNQCFSGIVHLGSCFIHFKFI